jgi:sugar transferase EpsL
MTTLNSLLKKGTGSEHAVENTAENGGREVPVPLFQQAVKRLLDIGVALTGLILLSPLLLLLALLVRIKLGSPVFFRQQRPGLRGKPFELLKFRTMTNSRDGQGWLLPDEKRLTRFGRFLRSTSLDELPELVNVLTGEMSLVGPRPLLMEYLDRYTPQQARRMHVKPGITGWAQINGRNAISWEDKFALDLWYVDHWSAWLDLRILIATVSKVLRREGIGAAAHCTMPEFTGSDSSRRHAA